MFTGRSRGATSVLACVRPRCSSLAFCACTVSAAKATTFHVVNDGGVPQLAQATVGDVGLTTATNEAGEVEPASEPGDVVTITRSDRAGACGAPEGPIGPSYTVPDPEPDFVEVVLPSVAATLADPALSEQERGLLGRLNEQRAAGGAPPLVGSDALAEAADGYAGALGGDPAATSGTPARSAAIRRPPPITARSGARRCVR